MAVAGRVCPTRAAIRPPRAPPTVPHTEIEPNRSFAVRGSNRSLSKDQNPEIKRPPREPQCR